VPLAGLVQVIAVSFSCAPLLIVGTPQHLFVLSGYGDVIEPDEGVVAIGSGGPYAQAAATALVRNTSLDAENIARTALEIAADICIYTNKDVVVETMSSNGK